MSNLKYKTRGNSSPQGKSRVYFCCHPEDFNRCFESISDEILAKQNCAVWYTDEVIVHDEDFFLDLKQMQLFVMPITTNLLCTENEAIDIEFKFAIENHIPVLPLMQESGLEKIFNKRCGDLQFLDKNNTDVTAISYDEKLKKYLETVLIGDELAEKIRAAFDAYVFLSYRKKDRRYAQELMRLIHKNEFCRDMAIWYDEFLTPGENFNDSTARQTTDTKSKIKTERSGRHSFNALISGTLGHAHDGAFAELLLNVGKRRFQCLLAFVPFLALYRNLRTCAVLGGHVILLKINSHAKRLLY